MRSYRKDFVHGDQILTVSLRPRPDGTFTVQVGEEVHQVEASLRPDGRIRCTLDGKTFEADCASAGDVVQVRLAGRTWCLEPFRGQHAAPGTGNGEVEAPMTGTVIEVLVALGQQVEAGEPLVVMSAMKMEHKLVADIAGTVTELGAEAGQTVDQGVILVRVEPR